MYSLTYKIMKMLQYFIWQQYVNWRKLRQDNIIAKVLKMTLYKIQ